MAKRNDCSFFITQISADIVMRICKLVKDHICVHEYDDLDVELRRILNMCIFIDQIEYVRLENVNLVNILTIYETNSE